MGFAIRWRRESMRAWFLIGVMELLMAILFAIYSLNMSDGFLLALCVGFLVASWHSLWNYSKRGREVRALESETEGSHG